MGYAEAQYAADEIKALVAMSVTNTISENNISVPTSSAVYNYTRPVVITADDTTPPSDTRALWVYPAT